MSKAMGETLGRLEAVIHDRLAAGAAEASYAGEPRRQGRGKIAQKLGEEAVEAVIAAVSEDDPEADRRGKRPRLPPLDPDRRARADVGHDRRRTRPPPRHVRPRRKSRPPWQKSSPHADPTRRLPMTRRNIFARILRGELPSKTVL